MTDEKEFKLGVYMKLNGNLVLIEKAPPEEIAYKFIVLDGKIDNNPIVKYWIPKKNRSLMGWTSQSLRIGWEPTSYLNYSEYLGEL